MTLKKWQQKVRLEYVSEFSGFVCKDCGHASEELEGTCECGEPLQQLNEAGRLRHYRRLYSVDCCGEYCFFKVKDAINHAWKCSRGMLKGGAWK
jgi:predicted metal-binding protein